jgi:hypothetical protein
MVANRRSFWQTVAHRGLAAELDLRGNIPTIHCGACLSSARLAVSTRTLPSASNRVTSTVGQPSRNRRHAWRA